MKAPVAQRLVRLLRAFPAFNHANGLRDALRPLYWRFLDPLGKGLPVTLGDKIVRLPASLFSTSPDWTGYETASFREITRWLDAHPGPVRFIDIGSSVGVVSSFVLQTHSAAEVLAFESDATSLRAMDAVVPRSARHRLTRILGLLGDTHVSGQSLPEATAATPARLPRISPGQAVLRSCYVCLDGDALHEVPRHRLDALCADLSPATPTLLKCDVEGAELLVLQGALQTLRRLRPTLLLSVHPKLLPRFGHDARQIAALLGAEGFTWRKFDEDHEEHWLVVPARASN